MTEELEKLRTEFNERIDALLKPKPQFEVGKYYTFSNGLYNSIFFRVKEIDKYGTIFTDNENEAYHKMPEGDFGSNAFPKGCNLYKESKPATPEEVKQALVKEAERKKYKVGTKIKSLGHYPPSYDGLIKDLDYTYFHDIDSLQVGGAELYCQGQWAEIIKEEVIKIGGYEVKFFNTGYYCVTEKKLTTVWHTEIDGHRFDKSFWEAAQIVAEHSKASAFVGCGAKQNLGGNKWMVSLETINSILNKLK